MAGFASVGDLRAQALAAQYLGKGAPLNATIYGEGGKPDAFFAITAHTRRRRSRRPQSWGQQVIAFSGPRPMIPTRTRISTSRRGGPRRPLKSGAYDGKTVVIVWEHHRIADPRYEVTWRKLLKLGDMDPAVPEKWEGVNYDYIWIFDRTGAAAPFTELRQEYGAPYGQVPDNPWGEAPDAARFPEFYAECQTRG